MVTPGLPTEVFGAHSGVLPGASHRLAQSYSSVEIYSIFRVDQVISKTLLQIMPRLSYLMR